MSLPVTLDDVRGAAARIEGHAHRTPVLTSRALDALAGRRLFFKCEPFQRVGAFKFRGACNAVMKLDDATARRGVVTHSSGNHAQALALAARVRGIEATIVMPSDAPAVKRAAVAGYGATIVTCDPTQQAREAMAEQQVERTGGTLIPPYDHPDVIAGAGTLMLELFEQAPDLDAVLAPLGGGGMLSGILVAAHGLDPTLPVFGVEPALADDARESVRVGRIVPQRPPVTIADGLRTSLGRLTFEIVSALVTEILTVDEAAIADAMRLVMERMKVVVEPSAAVGLAAVLAPEFRALEGLERVGIVLSGGNANLDALPAPAFS